LLDLLALDDRFADMFGSATYRKQMRYGKLSESNVDGHLCPGQTPLRSWLKPTVDVRLVAAHSWDISGALAAG